MALLALPAIAWLLLAAHFAHAGLWPIAAACVAATALLAALIFQHPVLGRRYGLDARPIISSPTAG